MNIAVHLIWTIIPAMMMGLGRQEFLLALIFGVLIDLDHIFPLVPYYLKNRKIFYSGIYIKTPVQELIFTPAVAAVSLFFRTWVPLIFFLIHISLDYLFASVNRPFSPFSNYELLAPFPPKTAAYWVFTIFSIALFIGTMFYSNTYSYIIGLLG